MGYLWDILRHRFVKSLLYRELGYEKKIEHCPPVWVSKIISLRPSLWHAQRQAWKILQRWAAVRPALPVEEPDHLPPRCRCNNWWLAGGQRAKLSITLNCHHDDKPFRDPAYLSTGNLRLSICNPGLYNKQLMVKCPAFASVTTRIQLFAFYFQTSTVSRGVPLRRVPSSVHVPPAQLTPVDFPGWSILPLNDTPTHGRLWKPSGQDK